MKMSRLELMLEEFFEGECIEEDAHTFPKEACGECSRLVKAIMEIVEECNQ